MMTKKYILISYKKYKFKNKNIKKIYSKDYIIIYLNKFKKWDVKGTLNNY